MGPEVLVADLLRDDIGLTGTKIGCSIGVCGACSILVDGTLMSATVVDHVTSAMRIYGEESFGPVVSIVRVNGVDEAVREAERAVDQIARRFGASAVRPAALVQDPDLQERPGREAF